MNKRKNLGQHFLKSKTIARSIVDSAKITRNDIVLEIGTGHGILIPYVRVNMITYLRLLFIWSVQLKK